MKILKTRFQNNLQRPVPHWEWNWFGLAVLLLVPVLLILGLIDFLQPIQTGLLPH